MLVTLVALVALTLPAAAVAGPAVDEYSLDLPDGKGKVESPGSAPVADTAALPADVVQRLRTARHGPALEVIATSGALGAPSVRAGDNGDRGNRGALPIDISGEQPSVLRAATGAAGDEAVLGLILLLALAGGALYISRTRKETGRGE